MVDAPNRYTERGRYSGKVVLVTGAGAGIGAATAKAFASEGANLVLGSRTESKLKIIAVEIMNLGGKVVYYAGDSGLEATNQALVALALKTFGALHIAVNNAGMLLNSSIITLSDEILDEHINSNIKSLVYAMKHQLPSIAKSATPQAQGVIINIGSVASARPAMSQSAVFSGTKAFLDTFTRAAALEAAPLNVRVNAVNPGIVLTAATKRIVGQADMVHNFSDHISLAHGAASPEELSAFILDVASHRFLNGALLFFDGGVQAK